VRRKNGNKKDGSFLNLKGDCKVAIRIHPHARERMVECGATDEEVR